MKQIIKEACIQSIEEAKYYINQKASRFETCADLSKGGLTPDIELVNYINKNSNIPQVIMLRTNDNFSVNSEEIKLILKQIKQLKATGQNEFIFGFIKDDQIDIEACKIIINALAESKYDFHMAIDVLGNYHRDIPILIAMGFNRILTKGGNSPAINNIDSLKEIIQLYGSKIEILVGGSVTKDNCEEIINLTGTTQVHGTKIL